MSTPGQTPVAGGDIEVLVRDSFSYLVRELIPYLLISVVTLVPFFLLGSILDRAFGFSLLAAALTGNLLRGPVFVGTLLLSLLSLAAAVLLTAALIHAANTQLGGGRVSLTDSYRFALAKGVPFLPLYLVVAVVISVGCLLLVIPGLVAAFFLCLAPLAAAVDDVDLGEAVSRSCRYALKVAPELIVILVIALAVVCVPMLIPFIGKVLVFLVSFLVSPWLIIALALAYRKAKALAS